MGIQFCSRITIPNTNLNMKFLVALCLVASAMAIEDTADVAAAKADFNAAFVAAEKGEHAALAPKPVEALPVPELIAPVAPAVAPVAPLLTYAGYGAGLPYFNGYYHGA